MFYRSYGFTEVTRNNKHTFINHNGNMGNTEDNVRENFDSLYFTGAYDALSAHRHTRKFGSADYSFTMRIPNAIFNQIII